MARCAVRRSWCAFMCSSEMTRKGCDSFNELGGGYNIAADRSDRVLMILLLRR
jgi:hypothetical protein